VVVVSSPSLVAFHAAHVAVGAGVACLLSAGFAGVPAYFDDRDAPWAIGYVVAAQSVAWVVGNPLVGLLADAASWRLSYLVPGGFAALALAAGLLAPPSRPPRERAGGRPGGGLGVVLRDRSARSWAIAELVAYSAWTAELTYAGAFYVHSYGVSETAVGLLLAAGSLAFVVATLSTARLTRRFGRRRVIVGGALLMGTMLIPVLNVTPAVWFTLGLFWLMALGAGVRSTASSALGLVQLPAAAGSMMAARTASAQLGYAIGAAAGGAVLAAWGFGALGFVLFGGMAFSALLVARVRDPRVRAAPPPLGNPVPD
jgi:predicted MFS family arabinose efflux permease